MQLKYAIKFNTWLLRKQMDLKNILSQRINRDDIHQFIILTQGDNRQKQGLYNLLFNENSVIAYNAGWIMCHFRSSQNEWLYHKQEELIDEIFRCQHSGRLRMILTLLTRQPLAYPPRVDFLDFCLERVNSKEEPLSIQVLCIKLAYELSRRIPELCQELRTTLDLMESRLLKPSLLSIRKNVFKAMETGRSIQQY